MVITKTASRIYQSFDLVELLSHRIWFCTSFRGWGQWELTKWLIIDCWTCFLESVYAYMEDHGDTSRYCVNDTEGWNGCHGPISCERILISPWNMYITIWSSYLVFNFVFYSNTIFLFPSLRNIVLHVVRVLLDFSMCVSLKEVVLFTWFIFLLTMSHTLYLPSPS